jgi:hypothetical protein
VVVEVEAAATQLTGRTLLPDKNVAPATAHAKVKSMTSCFFSAIVMSLVPPRACNFYIRVGLPRLHRDEFIPILLDCEPSESAMLSLTGIPPIGLGGEPYTV